MGGEELEKCVTGWATRDSSAHLSPYKYTLRNPGPHDVMLRVLYCGICHTDLHQMRNYLGISRYPTVPGHEVVGVVTELGKEVEKFKIGEHVGVGCIIGSCKSCQACGEKMEQYCNKKIWTYNDVSPDGKPTQGGFSSAMVVDQMFVVQIPESLPLEQAAPLLCAGVTVYSPMKHFGMLEAGKRCGILVLGGVGHIGVKIAKALGHHVTLVSSSDNKRKEALEVLGADQYIVSKRHHSDAGSSRELGLHTRHHSSMASNRTIYFPVEDQWKNDYAWGYYGAIHLYLCGLIIGRKSIAGSFIGSTEETQQTLNFCAEKKVSCQIEIVGMDYLNEAMERLDKNDVRDRFVVDVGASNLDKEQI